MTFDLRHRNTAWVATPLSSPLVLSGESVESTADLAGESVDSTADLAGEIDYSAAGFQARSSTVQLTWQARSSTVQPTWQARSSGFMRQMENLNVNYLQGITSFFTDKIILFCSN